MFKHIKALEKPFTDRLSTKTGKHYFRDALATKRSNNTLTPSQVQFAIFSHLPQWVNTLMTIRNFIVKFFGFSVGTSNLTPKSDELNVGDVAGFLTVSEKHNDEIISFAKDKHMDFYLSVAFNNQNIIVSTLVNQKTIIGRLYVNCILPFHYIIARVVINNAVKAGRI